MFQFLANGSLRDCPAPKGACTCESKLYATTGNLALIAGFAQWIVGYRYSMAALSDALHALADAAADFLGMFIAQKVFLNQSKTKELRAIGNKLIAGLLVVGALIIGFEAYDRWRGDSYLVWLPAVVLVGLFGLAIDLIRFRMLSKARKHSNNGNLMGLIEHARSDAWHSGIIATIALLGIAGAGLGIESGLYTFMVHLADYIASLGLAGYMMFILAPRIWKGQGCCGQNETHNNHEHGPECKHHH